MMNKVETLLGFVDDISLFLALYAYGFFSHKCTAAVILPGRGLGRDSFSGIRARFPHNNWNNIWRKV